MRLTKVMARFATFLIMSVIASVSVIATETTQTYVVLCRQASTPADAAATMVRAGGTLVQAYPQIGDAPGVVVVAAQGNQNMDLSKRNVDTISPDYPPGSEV